MNATTELRADKAEAPCVSSVRMLAIGETGKYINGVAFKPTDWSDEGLPIVRIQNLTDPTKPMNRTARVVDPAYVVLPGDLLVSWSATLDAFIWDREPALLNQHIFKVVPNTELVSKKYLFFALRQAIVEMGRTEHLHGSTMKHINRGPFLAHRIRVPPLRAQAEIVAEIEKQLSRLEEAVTNLKRVKANAKRLASAILVEAVAGRLVPSMGASWRTVQVCEAGQVVLGRQRAPQYLTGRWSRKYLRVANIKDDAVDFSDVETMDFDEAHFAKYQLTPGDILVSEGQSPELLGQSAIFRGFTEPLCFQKTLHRFRAYPGTTTPEFAQIVFRSHVRSGVFRRLGSITTNIGHLTLEKFKAAPFPLPPLDEQHLIVAEVDRRLSIVREVEAEVDSNLKRARALLQVVLRDAFALTRAEARGGVSAT